MRQLLQLFEGGVVNDAIPEDILNKVTHIAKKPDEGSNYDVATAHIRHLPNAAFLQALRDLNYNTIVAIEDGVLAGILGYQKHGDVWHSFAYVVADGFGGKHLATDMARMFIETAHAEGARAAYLWNGDKRQRLSEENRKRMESLYARIIGNRMDLPFALYEGGEVGEIIIRPHEMAAAYI